MIELLTYYVIGGALIIGPPAVFFFIAFMPALMNTKGRMVGYKDHKTYGDISSSFCNFFISGKYLTNIDFTPSFIRS